eukprot:6403140-Amphidinium_carterae.1
MYYKPFRPTYQVLSRVGANSDHIVLHMTSRWMIAWEVLAHMDLGAEWHVQYYVMLDTEAPVPSLDPATCYVKKPCLGTSYSLWPLPHRGRKRGSTNKHASERRRRNKRRNNTEIEVQGLASKPVSPPPHASADNEEDSSGNDSISTKADDPMEEEQLVEEEGNLDELLEEHLQDLQAQITVAEADAFPGLEADLARVEQLSAEVEDSALVDIPLEEAEVFPDLEGQFGDIPELEQAAEVRGKRRSKGAKATFGGKRVADISVDVDGGKILFYKKSGNFVAMCGNELHGSCVLTRTSRAGKRLCQGRPLGLLSSWLYEGQFVGSKEHHWLQECWPHSHELRSQHRDLLAECPEAEALFEQERDQEPGEDCEPDICP